MPNPFAHVELNTDDPKQAEKFYRKVFEWELRPMPSMDYTMIDVGEGIGGGIGKKQSAEAPNAWLPYVTVDDVKKTLTKARKAGARIVVDYMSIGDMGAVGVFVDPAGATLGVWEAAATAPASPAEEPAPKPRASKARAKARPSKASAKKAPAKKASSTRAVSSKAKPKRPGKKAKKSARRG